MCPLLNSCRRRANLNFFAPIPFSSRAATISAIFLVSFAMNIAPTDYSNLARQAAEACQSKKKRAKSRKLYLVKSETRKEPTQGSPKPPHVYLHPGTQSVCPRTPRERKGAIGVATDKAYRGVQFLSSGSRGRFSYYNAPDKLGVGQCRDDSKEVRSSNTQFG